MSTHAAQGSSERKSMLSFYSPACSLFDRLSLDLLVLSLSSLRQYLEWIFGGGRWVEFRQGVMSNGSEPTNGKLFISFRTLNSSMRGLGLRVFKSLNQNCLLLACLVVLGASPPQGWQPSAATQPLDYPTESIYRFLSG